MSHYQNYVASHPKKVFSNLDWKVQYFWMPANFLLSDPNRRWYPVNQPIFGPQKWTKKKWDLAGKHKNFGNIETKSNWSKWKVKIPILHFLTYLLRLNFCDILWHKRWTFFCCFFAKINISNTIDIFVMVFEKVTKNSL